MRADFKSEKIAFGSIACVASWTDVYEIACVGIVHSVTTTKNRDFSLHFLLDAIDVLLIFVFGYHFSVQLVHASCVHHQRKSAISSSYIVDSINHIHSLYANTFSGGMCAIFSTQCINALTFDLRCDKTLLFYRRSVSVCPSFAYNQSVSFHLNLAFQCVYNYNMSGGLNNSTGKCVMAHS